jgi:hypothetical protein
LYKILAQKFSVGYIDSTADFLEKGTYLKDEQPGDIAVAGESP